MYIPTEGFYECKILSFKYYGIFCSVFNMFNMVVTVVKYKMCDTLKRDGRRAKRSNIWASEIAFSVYRVL